MQASFRQQTRIKAEEIELSSNEKITEANQQSNAKMTDLRENSRTRLEEMKNDQQLRRKQLESNYETKKGELDLKRMQREKDLELDRIKTDFSLQDAAQKKSQTLAKMRRDFETESAQKLFDVDRSHDSKTLDKYEIDSLVRIYQRGVKKVTVNQYSSTEK